jgi:hypothetical protein
MINQGARWSWAFATDRTRGAEPPDVWCASTCFRRWNALWVRPRVVALLGSIFAQPERGAHVREQLDTIAHMLGRQNYPRWIRCCATPGPDITAFAGFPVPHWEKMWTWTFLAPSMRDLENGIR